MPSFTLPPNIPISSIRLLPGRALIRVSPAEQKIGSIHLPEDAAERETQRQAAREGVLEAINTAPHPNKDLRTVINAEGLKPGMKVLYLGHADETDNEFVVVLHGQIIATETTGETSGTV